MISSFKHDWMVKTCANLKVCQLLAQTGNLLASREMRPFLVRNGEPKSHGAK